MILCSGCTRQMYEATPACAFCGRANAEAGVLDALRAYVGIGWDEHYRGAFMTLLDARQRGDDACWTWNWSAACFPYWFLYRRLYLAFACFVVVSMFLVVAAFRAVATGDVHPGAPIGLVPFLLRGFLADRLFFRKALAEVNAPGAPADRERLMERGKPLGWAVALYFTALVLGMMAFAGVMMPDAPGW